jgi:hypothetical protein
VSAPTRAPSGRTLASGFGDGNDRHTTPEGLEARVAYIGTASWTGQPGGLSERKAAEGVRGPCPGI